MCAFQSFIFDKITIRMQKKTLWVVKIGGNIIDNETKLLTFLKDFSQINDHKILVHGGGKIATQIADKLGIKSTYINGRRITDHDTIDVVTMVYGGLINKKIVARLQSLHTNAIGLTGADAHIIPAQKRAVKEVDFGWVGDIYTERIRTEVIISLLQSNITPVFAPLTHDGEGHMLNTNADTIAASLAIALSENYEVKLLYCFEKKGILKNIEDENSALSLINKASYAELLASNILANGILPKVENAFNAIDQGVKEVIIGHADDIRQNTSGNNTGTRIIA